MDPINYDPRALIKNAQNAGKVIQPASGGVNEAGDGVQANSFGQNQQIQMSGENMGNVQQQQSDQQQNVLIQQPGGAPIQQQDLSQQNQIQNQPQKLTQQQLLQVMQYQQQQQAQQQNGFVMPQVHQIQMIPQQVAQNQQLDQRIDPNQQQFQVIINQNQVPGQMVVQNVSPNVGGQLQASFERNKGDSNGQIIINNGHIIISNQQPQNAGSFQQISPQILNLPQVGNQEKLTDAQSKRQLQMQEFNEILLKSKQRHDDQVQETCKKLKLDISAVNSKLVCIRFRIERKYIKNGAREERRQSIHKLEMEKNLMFHPKKDRSKSIPTINMNLRLKALKDMKEDLLMRKSKISDEIMETDLEVRVPVMEYNYNHIKREIMIQPQLVEVQPDKPRKRIDQVNAFIRNNQPNSPRAEEGQNNLEEEKQENNPLDQLGQIQEQAYEGASQNINNSAGPSHEYDLGDGGENNNNHNQGQISQPIEEEPIVKYIYTKKYKTAYDIDLNEEQKIGGESSLDQLRRPSVMGQPPQVLNQKMQMQRIDQFKDQLDRMGVSIKSLKSHLRSNSVGGMGNFDHQQLVQFLQANMQLRNEAQKQLADNNNNRAQLIQESNNNNANQIMRSNQSFKMNMEKPGNPLLEDDEVIDLLNNIQVLPLNFQSREQFITMVKEIQTNKVLLVQLKQINQLQQLNKLNLQKVEGALVQYHSLNEDEQHEQCQHELMVSRQILIINQYLQNAEGGMSDSQNEREIHVELNKFSAENRQKEKENNKLKSGGHYQSIPIQEDEGYFNLNQIQYQLQKQQSRIQAQLVEKNLNKRDGEEEQKVPHPSFNAFGGAVNKIGGSGGAPSPAQPQNSAVAQGPASSFSVIQPQASQPGGKPKSSFGNYKISEVQIQPNQHKSQPTQKRQQAPHPKLQPQIQNSSFSPHLQSQGEDNNMSQGDNKISQDSVFQAGYSIKKVQHF